jgi:hypothetical protein
MAMSFYIKKSYVDTDPSYDTSQRWEDYWGWYTHVF